MIIRLRRRTIIKRNLVKRNISFFINFKIRFIFHVNNKFNNFNRNNATIIKIKNNRFNFAFRNSKIKFIVFNNNRNNSSSLNNETRSIFNNFHVFYNLITIFSIIIFSTTIDNHISKNINRIISKNINKNFNLIEFFNRNNERIITKKIKKIKKQKKTYQKDYYNKKYDDIDNESIVNEFNLFDDDEQFHDETHNFFVVKQNVYNCC